MTYTWYPDGRNLASLDVYTPGLYRVVRDINGCKKEATALVEYDSAGRIDLGKNQAVCCDEVLTLDANANGLKYKGYLWSTGETSKTITVNKSGQYTLEITNATACKGYDTINVDVR